MLLLTAILFAVLALASANGCAPNRTVFVPEASPMRIGPNARAKVWIKVDDGKEWTLSGNEIALPEGWWIVPSSYVEDERR